MRSHPRGSLQRLSDPVALWRAYGRVARGKYHTPAVAAFDLDADRHILELHRALGAGAYRHGPFRLHVIHDPKLRLIAAASVRDRVVHQALVAELAPTYEPGFIDQHFACKTGRGPQRAALYYLACKRRYRYRLSLDIQRYFPSIRHDILLSLFDHRLRDEDTGALLSHVLEAGGRVYSAPLAIAALGLQDAPLPSGCGMAIGSYVSQWSGALYLAALDHYIKRELKIPGYLRYMDDLALFHDDIVVLERAREAVARWLQVERALVLNPKRWQVHTTEEPSVFLGYGVSRAGFWPGPKLRRRLVQRVRSAAQRGTGELARTLASYQGIYTF